MTGLDWPGLMRAGLGQLRLTPDAFWRLTPIELRRETSPSWSKCDDETKKLRPVIRSFSCAQLVRRLQQRESQLMEGLSGVALSQKSPCRSTLKRALR